MPKFIVYAPDNVDPGTLDKRYEVRPSHTERLATLIDSGIVQIAGMITDPAYPVVEGGRNKAIGSLLIVEAENIEQVRKTVEEDVFIQNGVGEAPHRALSPSERGKEVIQGLRSARDMLVILRRSARTPAVRMLSSAAVPQYNYILTSRPEPAVTLITLNRPKALNALSSPLFKELNQALADADNDSSVGAIVLTGSEKAFAAGADIKEMKDKEFADVYKTNFLEDWTQLSRIRKPIIAAVSGYALGGGCELALMCDIILASETAKFGQPEINLGVIPGGGGSQRLAQTIGKSRTMELVLTGRMISAQEADKWGLVSRVVEGEVVTEAVAVAKQIASKSQIATQAGKEVVNAAYELSLAEGLRFERRIFQSLFATKDQKEGMSAFAEKRTPNFTHS